LELFFYWKNRGNMSTVRRPSPQRFGPPVHETLLNGGCRLSDLRLRLKREGVSSWSNLDHWSRVGRLAAAPAGDGGGATHQAMAPWPLLWWGSPRATASLSRRGLSLRGRRATVNSPKGVLGGGGDWSNARDGGHLAPIFGDDGRSQWGLSGNKKQSYVFLTTSSSFSYASIAASGGGR
jgi:hypothetical protein